MPTYIQSTFTFANGRRWVTLDEHLVAPLHFTPPERKTLRRARPAKVRKGLVEFLAMAHHWGGVLGVTGSMRHVGVRAVLLGLASVVAAETVDGKKVVHYRLTVGALVGELAERCFHAARAKGSVRILPDGDGARVDSLTNAVPWADVPLEVPRRTWPADAKACPRCRCTPDAPCVVALEDGCGAASCAPAGIYRFRVCSACEAA